MGHFYRTQTTASAYLATQLDDEYDQRPVQVRVVQVRLLSYFSVVTSQKNSDDTFSSLSCEWL